MINNCGSELFRVSEPLVFGGLLACCGWGNPYGGCKRPMGIYIYIYVTMCSTRGLYTFYRVTTTTIGIVGIG